MSFFQDLLNKRYDGVHKNRNLWEYHLNEEDFDALVTSLNNEILFTDPRDITLYFAEWWKRVYNGGTPSKQMVFESLPVNFQVRIGGEENFFKLAKAGARSLGIRWLKMQNMLYFRTLLLQGGLPLRHIKNNSGSYLNFLRAVMDMQPDSIEDFMYNSSITNYLPRGSRNEVIYENCLEIVRAIINGNDNRYQNLLQTDSTLRKINEQLLAYRKKLQLRTRNSKPKINWILELKENWEVSLRLGFNDKYTAENLSAIFGFEAKRNNYQFYLNDTLICSFRRTTGGDYKIQWHYKGSYKWNYSDTIPDFRVVFSEEGETKEEPVYGLIQFFPDFTKPTLWLEFDENQLKLVKGNSTSNGAGVVIAPKDWETDKKSSSIQLDNENLQRIDFEGEITIRKNEESLTFLSNVNSFDWTIMSQDRDPEWLIKSNMVIVRRAPRILLYDENGDRITNENFYIFYKSRGRIMNWLKLTPQSNLPQGCIDLKIEKDGIIAYDTIYNLALFEMNYLQQGLLMAKIEISNPDNFRVVLHENLFFDVEGKENIFELSLKTGARCLPKHIKVNIKHDSQQSLIADCRSPFTGARIVDDEGIVIEPNTVLNLNSLFGYRILKPHNEETVLNMRNDLKRNVIISKVLNKNSQPLLAFSEEFSRLFALEDMMDYQNAVGLEIKSKNERVTYKIRGYTEVLNTDYQYDEQLMLESGQIDMELFAIPLNCELDDIRAVPLFSEGNAYSLSHCENKQMVVVSSEDEYGKFLLPRYVNTDVDFNGISREERLTKYHNALTDENTEAEIWKELHAYYNICKDFNLSFSTFDQIRVISKSSKVAARTFFFLLTYSDLPESFIINEIPKLERDLGFCFHWIAKSDWQDAFFELVSNPNLADYANNYTIRLRQYFENNDLAFLDDFIHGRQIKNTMVLLPDFQNTQMKLGARVLKEIPNNNFPETNKDKYPFPDYNYRLELIMCSAIAVAESILNNSGAEYTLWNEPNNQDAVRRNVQYVQYLTPKLYNKIIHQLITS